MQKEITRFSFIIDPAHKEHIYNLHYTRRTKIKDLMHEIIEDYLKKHKKELTRAKRSK